MGARDIYSVGLGMWDFFYFNPTHIYFGRKAVSRAVKMIPREERIMILYGQSSAVRYGFVEELKNALEDRKAVEFGGIEPNPEYEQLMKGVKLAEKEGITCLIGLGGGSVIDAAKFIAAALLYNDDPWKFVMDRGVSIKKALPVGAVVTMPASGSEANNRAVISRRAVGIKRAFMSDHLFPRFAALDPTKTFTLPRRYIGNGVVDTYVHVLEQYLTYPVGGDVQDRLAEGLLLLLLDQGPRALKEPENYRVRANLMWCATLGLNGLIGAGVPQDWSAHRAGYELTMLYGLDHAQTLAILVPAMMDVRREIKREKLIQYGERIFGLGEGTEDEKISQAIALTRAFFEQMGLPTHLSDYGICDLDVELIIHLLTEHGVLPLGEKQDITSDVMRAILELCR
ncbi:MAG: iron-containing alcohol dehydrogenase [Syntrophales bacterium]|nr:iron-containing alcohol dehydrogenase [Syntrophales bacterium]